MEVNPHDPLSFPSLLLRPLLATIYTHLMGFHFNFYSADEFFSFPRTVCPRNFPIHYSGKAFSTFS